jgi:hypothetical protein
MNRRLRVLGAIASLAVALSSAQVVLAQESAATPSPAPDSSPSAPRQPSEVTPAPPAPTTTSEVEIDLAQLEMADLEKVTEDSLEIYGFASLSYVNVLSADRQVINQFIAKEGSFYVGDLNIYASKQIAEQWRTLIELRITYAPNGRVLADGTIENNQSYDQGNFGRPVNWGGINIERAWVEYDIIPQLTIQAGAFLTPYGIWNVDHGMPTIIPVTRPYVMNEQIFPERQAGIQLYGMFTMGDYALGYHATLSNGRGYFDQFRDLDETKAFGGRLLFQTPWLGSLRFGVSAYQGRFVDRESDFTRLNPETEVVDNVTPDGVRYDEFSYGFDILQEWRGLRVQAELIGHSLGYLDGARQADTAGFRPDTYSIGGYVLVGYRFDSFWNVMPYGFYQRYQREETSQSAVFSSLENYQIGLNFRPVPTLVLKVQWGQSWIPDAKRLVENDTLNTLGAQVSWVF